MAIKTPFGQTQVNEALADLDKYITGKRSIDDKATDNQRWWRLNHADESPNAKDKATRSTSAWAINSILNKHADIMDSFPKPNVLPRESDDEAEAKILSGILPVILDQTDYEEVYSNMGWDFCIDGGAITGVFWDSNKHDGLGDVAVANVDVHNLFWQPGVTDIQDSPRVYHVKLEDIDSVKARFPHLDAEKIGPCDLGRVTKYLNDDYIDTSNCVEVIDMYYKQVYAVEESVDGLDADGKPATMTVKNINTVMHLAIIVGDQLAFCSENESGFEKGYYEHGKYPFVVRRAYPIKDTPWGFGYMDIMKSPQAYIDAMDDDIIKIADMKARPRFWARKNANISIKEFADWSQQIVEVSGSGDLGDSVRQIDVYDVPSGIMQHRLNKIDELKETSGNRDFNQGSVSGGVTAASAVAALQEAGSKLSRDINKALYRGAREEFRLIIELIRQFYTEPRSFRLPTATANEIAESVDDKNVVSGKSPDWRFVQYSSAGVTDDDTMQPDGVRHRRSVFDISISAEKQSPFSRAAQNETIKELYSMGLFDPNNLLPAMTALDAMDFEGKDKIVQQLQSNSEMLSTFENAMQFIQQISAGNPQIAQMAMQMGLINPDEMQPTPPVDTGADGEMPTDRAAKAVNRTDNSLVTKARLKAAQTATPK